jgi:AcrR family transcriptional regulator
MSKKPEILKAATHLFATRGFKETSTAEMASLIGAAESTIFYHYRTKEEVLLAVLKKIREELLLEFESHRNGRQFPNGLALLEDTISFYFRLSGSLPEPFLLLHHRFPYELATVNPVCREHLEAIYNCFVDLFENAIRAGQSDGSIVRNSARKSAMIVFAMIDGLVRFNTYQLYDAGTLYDELLESCRRMLGSTPPPHERSA